MSEQTEQEKFWAGEFGDYYVERNQGEKIIAARTALWAKILSRAEHVNSILELGANIGRNLHAIRRLLPQIELNAVEINTKAVEVLRNCPDIRIHHDSLLQIDPASLPKVDLTLSSGVLIHINPNSLHCVYERLYQASQKYICLIEYYNPTPVEVLYRGHSDKLFKRDFAGEMLDLFPDLELVDYGFQYHRDINFPADDASWFLLRKPRK